MSEPAAPDARPAASTPRGRAFPPRPLAALAVVFYAGHAAWHIADGKPENLLWACHIGTLLVGLAILVRGPRVNATALVWLVLGLGFWIVDLAMGGELIPTSFLTHVGGTGLAIFVASRVGVPRGTWWRAFLVLCGLQVITRLTTPAVSNVNLVHQVYEGWEGLFSSYPIYWLANAVVVAVTFVATELIGRRLFPDVEPPARGDPAGAPPH